MCILNEGTYLKCGCPIIPLEKCARAIQNKNVCRMKDLRYDDQDDFCDGVCSIVHGMDTDDIASIVVKCHDTSDTEEDMMDIDHCA